MVPVNLADNAVQILESGGQEGSEGSLHPEGLSLSEAQEVGTADASHEAGLWAVQGNQVELQRHSQNEDLISQQGATQNVSPSKFSYPWT